MRAKALIGVVIGTLLFNAAAAAVAVASGWPAEFDANNDPHHVSDQWAGSGTAISAPVAPLAALVVFAALAGLRRRWPGIVGAVGATLVGVIFVVGQFGEPTFFHPDDAIEALFHVVGLLLALALIVVAGREALQRWRRE